MHIQGKSTQTSSSVSKPLNLSEESSSIESNEQPRPSQVAVFITHGMGQQVPFETIDSAVQGLRMAAERHGNTPITNIRTRTVQIDAVKTQRAEFEMRNTEGQDIEVHVYEGYWAPITEGQVTLRDVMNFLLGAGINGIRNSLTPFKRWMFGRAAPLGRQHMATLRLLTTLLVIIGIGVLNFITLLITGDKFLQKQPQTAFPQPVFEALTSTVGLYAIVSTVLGLSLFMLMRHKKKIASPQSNRGWKTITALTQAMAWAWVMATILLSFVILPLVIFCERFPLESITIGWLSTCWKIIWIVLLAISWKVRGLLVQYMGDVAAYIDSHSLDRFNNIRKDIKAKVIEQAKAVYSQSQYGRIALVGHSLGSVVTYDTLNALLNDDELNGNRFDVNGRTKLVLTFGSPLDKTAFVFASQIRSSTDTREALAASLQPMIQAYDPYRDIKWINIHAPRDIISGALEFYDCPDAAGYTAARAVQNIPDEDALIPLAAHTEYWENPTLFDELYKHL